MANVRQLRELENSEAGEGKSTYQLDFTIDVKSVKDNIFMRNVDLSKESAEEEAQIYVDKFESEYKAQKAAENKAPTE